MVKMVRSSTQINDEKSIIDINSNFDDDFVLVVLTKEYSEIEMDYKETIFSDYSNDSIE